MKEVIKYFQECGSKARKRLGIRTKYCLAIIANKLVYENGKESYNAIGAIGDITLYDDLPIGERIVAQKWVTDTCVLVSETKARNIHPKLFGYLDAIALPHGLTVGERIQWLRDHKPEHITLSNYGSWCKRMITTERATRHTDTSIISRFRGTLYSDYDISSGMNESTKV